MAEVAAMLDRLQIQAGKALLPADDWRAFLDEVRSCSQKVELEVRALRANREQLMAIIDVIPMAFFVKDHQSRFFLMNRACQEQWGMSLDDLRGTDGSQFFPPEQMAQFLATDRAIFENRKPIEFEETFWSAARKRNRSGYTFKRPMYDADGNPQFLVCVTLDITDRKAAETALRDSETRFREAIAHSPNPMMMHAEDGQVIMVSDVLTAITGYRLQDLPTIQVWADKVYSRDERIERRLEEHYAIDGIRYEGEFHIRTASGEIRLWDLQSQPLPKLPDGRRVVLSLGVDITERKRLEEELQLLATTDALTALPNRRQFLHELDAEFVRVQRFGSQHSSVLMLDLDGFKRVNDTYGHAAGDAMLCHVGGLLRTTLRRIDTPARIGGEEFAVILPGADADAAFSSAERLRKTVARTPLVYDGNTVAQTVSIGIAAMAPGEGSAEGALNHADAAMYGAKRNGRNRVEIAERARVGTAA